MRYTETFGGEPVIILQHDEDTRWDVVASGPYVYEHRKHLRGKVARRLWEYEDLDERGVMIKLPEKQGLLCRCAAAILRRYCDKSRP